MTIFKKWAMGPKGGGLHQLQSLCIAVQLHSLGVFVTFMAVLWFFAFVFFHWVI